ncbi:MAG: cytochrome c, partial [Terriglobia bacterium]
VASVVSRVRGCLQGTLNPPRRATNPSPGPRRLVKTPVAVHPLPRAEGEDPIFGSQRMTILAAALRWVCVGLCGLFLFGCRLDMHVQPKYKPLDPSTFFDDGRSARPEVPGTVAHGHLRADELLYAGKLNGEPADVFPFPITREVLDRGRERYNIYCSPCHDYTGSGRGMVVQRGFPPPPSYHLERLVKAPAGHFFEVISNGYGAMYSYASRVTPEDRWAIVAYIRSLQLSQHATLEDVPPQEREHLTEQAK